MTTPTTEPADDQELVTTRLLELAAMTKARIA